MNEFLPENAMPVSREGVVGPTPDQGVPDPHAPPAYPYRTYAQQPVAPDVAHPAQQPGSPGQPYGQSAPPAQPYGQSAPPAAPPQNPAWAAPPAQSQGGPAYAPQPYSPQPYGQPAPLAGPPQNPGWAAAPPTWTPAPAKKRKAWPWVLGIVGGLVVLAGGGTVVAIGVSGALHADQNDNYTAAPITAGDTPTLGDKLLVSESGAVAFEIGSDWIDANDIMDVAAAVGSLPDGASLMATYFTFDPSTANGKIPTLVMVVDGAPQGQVLPIDLKTAHEGYMTSAMRGLDAGGVEATATEPRAVTTANGLDGLVSHVTMTVEGTDIRAYEYTFVRAKRLVYVQVMTYDGADDDVTAALVTDSLRIDK